MKRFSLLLIAILSIGPTALNGAGMACAAEPDEEMVRKTINAFAESWNRHDMNALGALFAPDADFVQVNGLRWKGRQTIQTHIAFLHGTVPQESLSVTLPANAYAVFKASTYAFDRLDVRLIHKDVAVGHVAWTQLGDPRFKDPRRGMLTFVLVREGERWLINAAQNTLR